MLVHPFQCCTLHFIVVSLNKAYRQLLSKYYVQNREICSPHTHKPIELKPIIFIFWFNFLFSFLFLYMCHGNAQFFDYILTSFSVYQMQTNKQKILKFQELILLCCPGIMKVVAASTAIRMHCQNNSDQSKSHQPNSLSIQLFVFGHQCCQIIKKEDCKCNGSLTGLFSFVG